MSTSVFCIARSRFQADEIVNELQEAGFPLTDISILYPESSDHHDLASHYTSKAPTGATTGAATGGIAGGVVGLLAGVGVLAVPAVGPLVAAGPIMAILSGAAVGAATGGLLGGLIGFGLPEVQARHFETKLRDGNYFISVHTAEAADARRVKSIFGAAEAEDIGSTSEEPVGAS